jgi:hypothetical protein
MDGSQTPVAPPVFLADLLGNVLGATLAAWPASRDDYPLSIGFGPPEDGEPEGLFIDPTSATGLRHDGVSWTVFEGGRPRFGHAWDDNQPDEYGPPIPFEAWVRREVVRLIDWRATLCVRSVWGELSAGVGGDALEHGQQGIDELLALGMALERHGEAWYADTLLASAVAGLARGVEGAVVGIAGVVPGCTGRLVSPASAWARFLHWVDRAPEDVVRAVRVRLRHEIDEEVVAFAEVQRFERLTAFCRAACACPDTVRVMFATRLVEVATDVNLLHVAAAEIDRAGSPALGVTLLEAALALDGDNRTILTALQGRYLEAGQTERAEHIGRRLEPAVFEDAVTGDVQDWIDEYSRLANLFSSGTPRPSRRVEHRANKLIGLEADLNAYWRENFPSHLDEAVAQGRFLSSGSGGYVGWLRNERRFGEAVDYTLAQLADDELTVLRHRAHPVAFESFFHNALGSFIDGFVPEHVRLGVALVDRVEQLLPLGHLPDLSWMMACVLARGGRVERALDHVERGVESGFSAEDMAADTDLASIVDHPRFVDLRGAR